MIFKVFKIYLSIVLVLSTTGTFSQCSKFEPPNGKMLLFIGQDLGAVGGFPNAPYNDGYIENVGGPVPAGVTTYFALPSLKGMANSVNNGSGDNCAQCITTTPKFKSSVLAIGLYLVNELGNINEGNYDAAIHKMAKWIKDQQRPVFLRIGYEFDGPWNNYKPEAYKPAFRRIVDLMRLDNVTNCAFVWQGSGLTADSTHLMQWYPGDGYVDWVSYSHFKFVAKGGGEMTIARNHHKPVMIAESTPQGDIINTSYQWDYWFGPLFKHIENNKDVIKALAYINVNWESQPLWQGQGWGDSRIQNNDTIKKKWLQEITSDAWIHASDSLFKTLECKDKSALFVSAGQNQLLIFPKDATILDGYAIGGVPPYKYNWKKLSGPLVTAGKTDSSSLAISGLNPGEYLFELKVTDQAADSSSNFVKITIYKPENKKPFKGSPWRVPGKIEAEDFDEGGTGISYLDNTNGNEGNLNYRSMEDVDIATTTDGGSGVQVAWIATGEWMEYTVNVSLKGKYKFNFRTSNGNTSTNSFHVEMDRIKVGSIDILATGGWNSWKDVAVDNIALDSGIHVIRLYMDKTPGFNLNYFNITSSVMNTLEREAPFTSFQLNPNPVKDLTTVSFSLSCLSDVHITIVNLVGKVVMEKTYSSRLGEFSQQLNLENLPEGIYVLSVDTGQKQRVYSKIVKL